jgi:hypothetical protein
VCAGPDRELVIYREKYSGIDKPRKSETPTMKRLRIEVMLVNCRKDSPTAAGDTTKRKISCTVKTMRTKKTTSSVQNYKMFWKANLEWR